MKPSLASNPRSDRQELADWRFGQTDAGTFSHFDRWGFAVIEDVLEVADIRRLRDAFENVESAGHRRNGMNYALRNGLCSLPAVVEIATSRAVRSLVEPLLGPRAFAVKATLFDKSPEANWKVPWHQDLTICVEHRVETPGFSAWSVKEGVVNVQPPEQILGALLAVRLHLDDCDESNGPLRVLRGSHQTGKLAPEAIADWQANQEQRVCPVGLGGALLMRPLLLHASSAAVKPRRRRVVHLEFAAVDLPGELRWANRVPLRGRRESR